MTDTTEKPAAPLPPAVYAAIASCSAAISKDGIGKDRRNQQQGYSFRGIDDVYNAMASILAANGLVILPRVLSRDCTERQTAKGGALFNVVVRVEFDLIAAADGSRHTVSTYGEAMDSADKATNKAMSAAYKYMAMQVFCIPTEGDNDADAHTHEVAPLRRGSNSAARPTNGNGARRDDRSITVASARKRLVEAGLTREGGQALLAELAPAGATTIDALPDPILKRLATAGPSDADVARWNGAAAPAADSNEEQFDESDPPIHWQQTAATTA